MFLNGSEKASLKSIVGYELTYNVFKLYEKKLEIEQGEEL